MVAQIQATAHPSPPPTTIPHQTPEDPNPSVKANRQAKKATKTIHLTRAEFLKRVINYEANSKEWKYLGDKPAIIDFYATWCGPCKRIAPILDELAAEYEGKIYIYKIDTDKERELSTDFGIQSIPTIFFVPKKGDPKVAQGAMSKEELKKIIDSFLLEKK